jgi:hypothetical protein
MQTPKLTKVSLATVAGLFVAAASVQAQVLLNDTFSDNERATQSLTGSAEWAFAPNGAIANTALSAASGALVYTPTAGAAQYSTAYFTTSGSPISLADGEAITLSFDFAFSTIAAATQEQGLRFGIFNSGGTRYAPGFSGAAQPFLNLALNQPAKGYFAYANPTATTGTSTFTAREEFSGSGSATTVFGGSGALSTPALNTAAYLGLVANTTYQASLTITRSGANASISSSINGITVSGSDAGATAGFAYDEIVIFTSSGAVPVGNTFTLDNVNVTITPAPEPSTAVLAGLGLATLIASRRRVNVR